MIGNGFRIGRLYGINIRVDWSWLLIMALITWNLFSVLGTIHPDWPAGLRLGLSLLAGLLFFASVLAHELAHSVVARARGLPVKNIILFLFGGVSNISREPPSAKSEFLIAIAGPASSIVIGALMLGAAAAGISTNGGISPTRGFAGSLTPATTILMWLGSINVFLALFNLIPGFPLDGGRVLRSIFWGVTKNLKRATLWASIIGRLIAWMMIFAGAAMIFGVRIPLFGTGLINGLWLGFIGWFLNSASVQSYQQIAIQDMLEGVPVAWLMRANPPTVSPELTVTDFVHQHLMRNEDQAFPVVEENRLMGIVTVDDVRKARKEEWPVLQVKNIMTPDIRLVTIRPEEDAAQAVEKLIQGDVRQLPVVRENSEFQGVLRRNDVMRWLQRKTGNGRPGTAA